MPYWLTISTVTDHRSPTDTVGVLCKLLHIFTNAKYVDMLYIYGFCNGSATAADEGGIFENDLG
jgi:hypothetical protein